MGSLAQLLSTCLLQAPWVAGGGKARSAALYRLFLQRQMPQWYAVGYVDLAQRKAGVNVFDMRQI
jgi:hypothetical protein